jgi:hypothetical protein
MSASAYKQQENKWKKLILQQKNSGQTITQWCLENKILLRSFFYWRSKVYPKPFDRSCFTELKNNKGTGITIEYHDICIRIDNHFDPETLKNCLTVLRGIKC